MKPYRIELINDILSHAILLRFYMSLLRLDEEEKYGIGIGPDGKICTIPAVLMDAVVCHFLNRKLQTTISGELLVSSTNRDYFNIYKELGGDISTDFEVSFTSGIRLHRLVVEKITHFQNLYPQLAIKDFDIDLIYNFSKDFDLRDMYFNNSSRLKQLANHHYNDENKKIMEKVVVLVQSHLLAKNSHIRTDLGIMRFIIQRLRRFTYPEVNALVVQLETGTEEDDKEILGLIGKYDRSNKLGTYESTDVITVISPLDALYCILSLRKKSVLNETSLKLILLFLFTYPSRDRSVATIEYVKEKMGENIIKRIFYNPELVLLSKHGILTRGISLLDALW